MSNSGRRWPVSDEIGLAKSGRPRQLVEREGISRVLHCRVRLDCFHAVERHLDPGTYLTRTISEAIFGKFNMVKY